MSQTPRTFIAVAAVALGSASCKPVCELTESQCDVDGARLCVNLSTDDYNCGACGVSCAPGLTCTAGVCAVVCPNNLTTCPGGSDGGAYCADALTDALNCGACGATCAVGEVCTGGACASACAEGLSICGTSCVDVAADPGNCGGCGVACATDETCTAGACAVVCPDGGCPATCATDQIGCTGVDATGNQVTICVDPQFDSYSCGGCGIACPTGQSCELGVCTCAPGYTACGRADGGAFCSNLVTDIDNCGTCGLVCPAGSYCNNACISVNLASVSSPTVSGETVTLLGTGFGVGAQVLFGRTPATVLSVTPVELQVTVPPGVSGETAVTVSLGGALSNPVLANVWGTTNPAHASGPYAGCTTAASNTGRKIAVDSDGNIYVGFQCGNLDAGAGAVADYVAASTDYGGSFHQTKLPLSGYLELGLQAGAAGTVFAAAFTPATGLVYLFTTDYGTSWSTPVVLDANVVPPAEVSLAYASGVLQVTASEAASIVLFSSNSPTSGAPFTLTSSNQLGAQYFDVLLEPLGAGFVAGDFSSVLIQPETNGGLDNVTQPTSPQGAAAFYSDWALTESDAGAVIYGGGLSSFPLAAPAAAFAIFASDLTTAYPYSGTEVVDVPQAAAIAADSAGNGYLVAQSLGGIGVQQLPYAASAASPTLTLASKGSWPVVANGLGQSVVVGYTDSDGGIVVAIQMFP